MSCPTGSSSRGQPEVPPRSWLFAKEIVTCALTLDPAHIVDFSTRLIVYSAGEEHFSKPSAGRSGHRGGGLAERAELHLWKHMGRDK